MLSLINLCVSEIDVKSTIRSVHNDGGRFVPGVQHTISFDLELTNQNSPDLNFDTAEVERNPHGDNFNVTLFVINGNITANNVSGFQLATVTHELTAGNLSTSLTNTATVVFSFNVHVGFNVLIPFQNTS